MHLISCLIAILFFFSGCSSPRVQEIPYTPPPKPILIEKPSPLIVLDPGHGGSDDGTKSKKGPVYREKGFNLTLARIVNVYLKELGYRTHMTRSSDVFIPLKTRALQANQLKADLFVSIHFNAAETPGPHGVEVFYPKIKANPQRLASSKKLSALVLEKILIETGANSRGTKAGDYLVIRETEMPAILIESGFLTNKEELDKILHEPNYLKKIGWGIAQGIDRYLNDQSNLAR